jgi:uncharacterized protein YcfJ
MNRKAIIYIGLAIGSSVGGFVPMLWGAGAFSMSSLFLSAIGGIAGIYAGFKISRY